MSRLSIQQRTDARCHLHPFSDNRALGQQGTRIIHKGEGIWIEEANGHRLLDGMSGLWCVNLGYGRPELIEAATQQLGQLAYYNSFFQCTAEPVTALAELILAVAPTHIDKVFFTGSGSEANDTVIRMVRWYWQLMQQPERRIIISRRNAYHGSTIAGMSLGGMAWMHEQGGPRVPDIEHIDQPYHFREGQGQSPEAFGLERARQLEARILALGPGRVAAFVAEPIQGAGGVIIPPDSYWPEIRRICDQYGILLVCDEVISGFGRTGEWFGSTYYGLEPDLMPVAKGLTSGYIPMGAVLVGRRVARVLASGGEFNHGFTYSGHPVAAAVAIAAIRCLQKDGLVERIRTDIGPYFGQQLMTLADHPLVGEVRHLGLFGAIELVQAKSPLRFFEKPGAVGTVCRDICVKNGLVMRATGDTMLLAPPFVISRLEVDRLVGLARDCLDQTASAVLG
jgi:putrescine aminotransferase